MSKEPTAKQIAARKKFGEAAKKRAAERKAQKATAQEATGAVKNEAPEPVTIKEDKQSKDALQAQVDQLMADNALFKAALLRNDPELKTPAVNQRGNMVGTFEKYALDPENYPDPTERLADEKRLEPLAFKFNYTLDYNYTTRQYDTKQGINTEEPEFTIVLNRVMLDDEGQPTNKRYVARRLIFHEDPQAALVIARDNNIDIDKSDEKFFLNEMRYLRVKDWLFDYFWPKPVQPGSVFREEVIGNRLVEVFTVNSEDAADLSGGLNRISKKL